MAKRKQKNVSSNKCKDNMLKCNNCNGCSNSMNNSCNENEPNTEEQPENELRQVVYPITEIDL